LFFDWPARRHVGCVREGDDLRQARVRRWGSERRDQARSRRSAIARELDPSSIIVGLRQRRWAARSERPGETVGVDLRNVRSLRKRNREEESVTARRIDGAGPFIYLLKFLGYQRIIVWRVRGLCSLNPAELVERHTGKVFS
jgi:hypothetical protein